jgi:hypothetical protein
MVMNLLKYFIIVRRTVTNYTDKCGYIPFYSKYIFNFVSFQTIKQNTGNAPQELGYANIPLS